MNSTTDHDVNGSGHANRKWSFLTNQKATSLKVASDC
jgi:hypothetical protein